MGDEEQIIKELHQVPRQRYREILAFIRSIRNRPANETAYAGESSLAKDWLRSEEDEAWADL